MVRVGSPKAGGNGSPAPGIFQGMFCLKLCNKFCEIGESVEVGGIPEVEVGNPAAIPFPGRILLFSAGSGVSLITSGRSSLLSSLENIDKINFFVKLNYLFSRKFSNENVIHFIENI